MLLSHPRFARCVHAAHHLPPPPGTNDFPIILAEPTPHHHFPPPHIPAPHTSCTTQLSKTDYTTTHNAHNKTGPANIPSQVLLCRSPTWTVAACVLVPTSRCWVDACLTCVGPQVRSGGWWRHWLSCYDVPSPREFRRPRPHGGRNVRCAGHVFAVAASRNVTRVTAKELGSNDRLSLQTLKYEELRDVLSSIDTWSCRRKMKKGSKWMEGGFQAVRHAGVSCHDPYSQLLECVGTARPTQRHEHAGCLKHSWDHGRTIHCNWSGPAKYGKARLAYRGPDPSAVVCRLLLFLCAPSQTGSAQLKLQ